MRTPIIQALLSLALAASARAADAVASVALDKEIPTLHSLGFVWTVAGDENGNASVEVSYRTTGAAAWRQAMPLRRVEVDAMEERKPPAGQGVFAGSIMFLEPATAYDVRLKLVDPDGGSVTQQFVQQTRAEPVAPTPLRTLHVIPGGGGGTGTEADPYKGLPAAFANAKAGDLVLFGQGTYTLSATVNVAASGTSAAPIVFRGKTGDAPGLSGGLAVIEGPTNKLAIGCYGKSHIFFERLTFRSFAMALQLNGSSDVVVRRCRMENVNNGVFGDAGESRFFVADNELAGIEPFPRPDGWVSAGEPRGVQLSGAGHVVCYNRVRNFRDGVDVRSPSPVRGIDFHNNDISEMTDDGIELDFTDHNTRAFHNRITNTQTGISFQPIRGGPAYAVRNVLMNVIGETFKLHLSPTNPASTWETGPHRTSGGVMMHNTVVKLGPAFRVWSSEGPAHNFLMRNNLLVGAHANAIDLTMPMRDCDFDFDAYVGGGTAFTRFAYWNKANYATRVAFAAATGQQSHGLQLAAPDGIFAAGCDIPDVGETCSPVDARLSPGSPMIDRGVVLPGINDDCAGAAPDIGAVEFGSLLPCYGPRPLTANVAPAITQGASTTMAVHEDTAGAKTLNATDADGDSLTWSILTQGSKGVAATSGTGVATSVTYTPTANLNGTDSFVVQVADGRGGVDTITVTATITAVNDAPSLAMAIPNQSATVAVPFSYAVPLDTFTDVEGTTLTWTSNETLGWLAFNATTRTFSGTAAASDVAATTITVTASDGALSASDSFVLTVGSVANAVPVIASASAAPATVSGTSTALSCSASDDGGESNLTYTWSATGPAAVTYSRNGTNAAKTATATFVRAGAYVFIVSARDAGNLIGTRTVNVSVAATPTTLTATPVAATLATGSQAVFSASASDQFGVLLAAQPAVTWTASGGGGIDAAGQFTAGAIAGGPWTITATAGSLSDTSQVTVMAAGGGGASADGGSSGGGCGAGAIGLLLLPLACVGRRRRSGRARLARSGFTGH